MVMFAQSYRLWEPRVATEMSTVCLPSSGNSVVRHLPKTKE